MFQDRIMFLQYITCQEYSLSLLEMDFLFFMSFISMISTWFSIVFLYVFPWQSEYSGKFLLSMIFCVYWTSFVTTSPSYSPSHVYLQLHFLKIQHEAIFVKRPFPQYFKKGGFQFEVYTTNSIGHLLFACVGFYNGCIQVIFTAISVIFMWNQQLKTSQENLLLT